ncbi:MAG: GNAT family N-acetyltransferase [Defluviitaleaceae bacterium]|nr:GNAT family N-acetyltransferase [Defluviitaleaceae bacterium]
MVYKKASIKDTQTLVAFRKLQLIDEGQAPDTNIDKELTSYFESSLSNGSLTQFIALENDVAVATGGVHFYLYPPSFKNVTGKMAYIANMYTSPDFRGKGIAKALLNLVIKEAEEREHYLVRLHSSEQGYPVYKKYGFDDTPGFMALMLKK